MDGRFEPAYFSIGPATGGGKEKLRKVTLPGGEASPVDIVTQYPEAFFHQLLISTPRCNRGR